MAQKLTASMPQGIVCVGDYVVKVRAVDPTTGADVAGVTVSNVSMQVITAEGETETITVPAVPPLFVYGPNE